MVFRVEKSKNYTVMSNYHLRDKNLSLKAKGLLSWMLSLPDDWDYSIAGIVACCKEGETTINTALRELQKFGYVKVNKIKPNEDCNRIHYEYNVYEYPQDVENQDIDSQGIESLGLESQGIENQVQINTNKQNTNKTNTKKNKTNSKELVQNFDFGKKSNSKKENLYNQCIHMIDDFTNDTQIKNDLHEYLQLLLEMRKDGSTFYANNWKGLLRKLKDLSTNTEEQHKIICQSIERGYKSFFPVNDYQSSNRRNKFGESYGVSCEHITEEELEEMRKHNEERARQGLQTKF